MLLCDSGGQYKYGTTDVTRTICFKKPSKRVIDIFTRVLKGHIAVANVNLNKINKGYLIDKKARYWLNKINLDYGHGTVNPSQWGYKNKEPQKKKRRKG